MNCEDLNGLDGLQFVPVDAGKKPIPKKWQTTITKYDLSNVEGVGLVCGVPSGNLEALDFDLKYDLSGDLFESYKKSVSKVDKSLLSKMVVQKTRSNGYHFLYRCSVIFGNTKLASRHTTEQERDKTYRDTYSAEIVKDDVDDAIAKSRAEKAYEGDKKRTLIETRGLGGQVVVAPSAGYDFVFGDLISISEITPEERDILITVARSFNEYFEEVIVPKSQQQKKTKGLSPFDDYNERGDIVGLLQNHGWKVVSHKGKKTHFLRPGQTTAQTSGNYDHDLKWFSVFTTSSEFNPEHGYRPYAVFATLECNKDFSEAAKKLLDMGYGERDEPTVKEKAPSTRVIQSRVNVDDDDYSFLATGADYNDYLQQVIDGTLPMGLTTGSPALDEHFLFKEGNMVSINGIDNVGKSKVMWYLLLLAAMYHGWKCIIFSSENTLGSFMRTMMQYYWGKQLHGKFAMSENERSIAKQFIEDHFKLIKSQEDLYNYKDVLNMVKKARKKFPDLKVGLIDPYNSLKIDLSGFSKLSTHEYHYEAMSEIKAYGQATKFGWFINHHAYTGAARQKDGEKKYPAPPGKADTEGGQKIANKTDDFITIHRLTQHPQDKYVTEIHVRKIKETETGGMPTDLEQPVKFEMYKGGTAFLERLEGGGYPVDPIQAWHNKKNGFSEISIFTTEKSTKQWWDRETDDIKGVDF